MVRRRGGSACTVNTCCKKSCRLLRRLSNTKSYLRGIKPCHPLVHEVKPILKSQSYVRVKNRADIEADSLAQAVGMLCSNLGINKNDKNDKNEIKNESVKQSADFATYLKAFALIYILPEEDWTDVNIDSLINECEELYKSSEGNESNKTQSIVYSSLPEMTINRKFEIDGHKFTIELGAPFMGNKKQSYNLISANIMKNLILVLREFFRMASYCLLWCEYGYLLIWCRNNVYFVLDINGRKKKTLRSANKGVTILVCLKTLDNVGFFISHLTGVKPSDQFLLREIIVLQLETPDGRIYTRDYVAEHRVQYEIVNNNYAYLKSNLHLSLNPKAILRNRSSIMVGVIAIIASKIDHPATWNSFKYDQIICHGFKICCSYWDSCLEGVMATNLGTFPTQLRIGQFLVEIKLLPNILSGEWCCTQIYSQNDFESKFTKAFLKHKHLLFQINHQMYAIWKKNNFIYISDPYRHTIFGSKTEIDKTGKFATIRMFRNMDAFLQVFHNILMQSNNISTFHMHAVQVRNIGKCPVSYVLTQLEDDLDVEVISLNENIEFSNRAAPEHSELAQISNFEIDLDNNTDKLSIDMEDSSDELESKDASDDDLEGIESDDSNGGIDNVKRKPTKAKGNYKGKRKNKRNVGSKDEVKDEQKNKYKYKVKGKSEDKSKQENKNKGKQKIENKEKKKDKNIIKEKKPKRPTVKELRTRSVKSRNSEEKVKQERLYLKTDHTRVERVLQNPKNKLKLIEKNFQSVPNQKIDIELTSRWYNAVNAKRSKIIPKLNEKPFSNATDDVAQPSQLRQLFLQSELSTMSLPLEPSQQLTQFSELPHYTQQPQPSIMTYQSKPTQKLSEFIESHYDTQQSQSSIVSHQSESLRKLSDFLELPSDTQQMNGTTEHQLAHEFGEPQQMQQSLQFSQFQQSEVPFQKSEPSHLPKTDTSIGNDRLTNLSIQRGNCLFYAHNIQPDKSQTLPGYTECPYNMAICGSESGTMESLCRLMNSAFKYVDRVVTMTPWGNYVVFRECDTNCIHTYYVFEGCTCDIDYFRHLDLRYGTAGLLPLPRLRDVISYIIDSREMRAVQQLRTRINNTD